jgi:predicted RNA-binding protein with PIN domain
LAEPTLYLFDGSNLFHAGDYEDRDELVDDLASFVALKGARGVLVFDGHGVERQIGALEVRFAPHADDVLERLAAEHRDRESVLVVTSDAVVRGTAGHTVGKRGSRAFLGDLAREAGHREAGASRVRDRLDPETAAKLERLRRGQDSPA